MLDCSCWTRQGDMSAKLLDLKACHHRRLERQTSHGWTMESVAIYKACKCSRRTSCLVNIRRMGAEGIRSSGSAINDEASSCKIEAGLQSRGSNAWDSGFALNMHLDLSHDLGGVWYLEVLWLARPNLPRQSAIANQNSLDHVPVPDLKCWFRPCASLMPTIYRAMGLDAASNRYPPDVQRGRHTKRFVPQIRQVLQPAFVCWVPLWCSDLCPCN
jgi:hypothetical protein